MSYRFYKAQTVQEDLGKVEYLADNGIAGIVYLGDRLQKPILVDPLGRKRPSPARPSTSLS